MTEIMVAAWSIGLGVLLSLFFSHCLGDQQLFLIILVTIIDYFYFFNIIICLLVNSIMIAFLPRKKCEKKNKTSKEK